MNYKEIIRFLIVGGLATICDYIVFYLCNLVILKNINVTLNLVISTLLGFLVGLLVNWFLQKFVFKEAVLSRKNFVKFFVFSFIGLLITEVIVNSGTSLYENLYILGIDFYKLLFKCLATGVVLVFNYLTRKFLIFKEETK